MRSALGCPCTTLHARCWYGIHQLAQCHLIHRAKRVLRANHTLQPINARIHAAPCCSTLCPMCRVHERLFHHRKSKPNFWVKRPRVQFQQVSQFFSMEQFITQILCTISWTEIERKWWLLLTAKLAYSLHCFNTASGHYLNAFDPFRIVQERTEIYNF